MQNINKLIDSNDSIDFGIENGEPFKWIYLLNISYLVWLIEETDLCFIDLELFYYFGKPLLVNEATLCKEDAKSFVELIKATGDNLYTKGSKRYKITIAIYVKALEDKIIIPRQFVERDFKFDEKTIACNARKLQHAKPYFYSINKTRDHYLKRLFEV